MAPSADVVADVLADHFPVESDGPMYGPQWSCAAENGGRGCTFAADRGDLRAWFEHLAAQVEPALIHH